MAKKLRRKCPLCVNRRCANCYSLDAAVNRFWLAENLPGGECRRCGAVRGAVTETPVRHTNPMTTMLHVDLYADHLFIKPPKLIRQDPRRMAAIETLLMDIVDDVFQTYNLNSRIQTSEEMITFLNERNAIKLRIEATVRKWVADHPVLPLGYSVAGDNGADGDSVYLYCARCPREDVAVVVPGTPSLGQQIGRFPTNVWDDPPTELTVAYLIKFTRKHDREVHGGEAG